MAVRGVRESRARLQRIQDRVFRAIEDQIEANAQELLDAAKDLAPELSRDLIDSGHVTEKDDRKTGSFRRRVIFDAPYAIRWHEESFTPGPITRTKPGAGRKYLTRAYNKRRKKFQSNIAKTVRATIRVNAIRGR